jgi:hypothetical protein
METDKKLWFRAKRFGWGWTPTSWQGWIITVIYIIGLVHFAIGANKEHSGSDFLINFGINFIVITVPFLIICYLKGEKPHWQWNGKPRSGVDSQNS